VVLFVIVGLGVIIVLAACGFPTFERCSSSTPK
jgi:hypothetical protein